MKLSITARLFLAVIAVSVFAVLAMGVAANWSYRRGFVGYLNEQAVARLDDTAPRLARAYARHGSWQFLHDNRREFFHMLKGGEAQDYEAASSAAASSAPGRPPPEPQVSDLTGALLRVSLLDEQQRFVIGYDRIRQDAITRPILVEGRQVGTLALAPFQTVTGPGELRFERNQVRASWLIGAVCVMLAAVIALWLARRLLRPVVQVAEATHRLAAGELASRVPDSTADDEVGKLARDFNTLADTLERNERMRRAFFADVSHELRTPLGVLHGELEALEDGVHALTPSSVKSLQAEVATMNKLVSDLYDLSLADVGELAYHRRPVDVGEVLGHTIEAFTLRLAEAGLALETQLPNQPLPVLADARRLQQLFNNLMDNSLRYTDRGGRLQVQAWLTTEETGPVVQVRFADAAPGVPAELMPRLFDRFYRVEASRNRASGGAGLGLAISRSIATAHGGSLVASPSALGGLTMTVRLPAGEPAPEAVA